MSDELPLNEINAAFAMLDRRISHLIRIVNQDGADAFGQGDYPVTRQRLVGARGLERILERTKKIHAEWVKIEERLQHRQPLPQKPRTAKAGEPAKSVAQAKDRQATEGTPGRLRPGLRTPQRAFFLPILQALVELDGQAQPRKILQRVEQLMGETLNAVDQSPLPSAPHRRRWQAAACWARTNLLEKGLLDATAPKGIWKISEEGREYLQKNLPPPPPPEKK